MTSCALLLTFCFALAFAQNIEDDTDTFSLFMTGPCHESNGQGFCRMKGPSQVISTMIAPADDVIDFSVEYSLGSYALIFLGGEISDTDPNAPIFKGNGNMTFGTHNARSNAIFFEVSGPVLNNEGGDWGWTALAGAITHGTGQYVGWEGVITIGGSTNGTAAFALVSGHIWDTDSE